MGIGKIFPILCVWCVFFSYTICAQTTLNSIVKIAIDSNPEIRASWQAFLVAEQNVDSAASGFKPKIDVIAQSNYVQRNYGLDQSYASNEARVSVSQMLYDGFYTSSEVNRLEAVSQVRYLELLNQIEQVALDAASAYIDVLLYRELLLVAENNLKIHVDVFKHIEKSASAGVARRVDLEQVSGRLSLAESNLMTVQSNYHDVSARYLRVIGQVPVSDMLPVYFLEDIVIEQSLVENLMTAYRLNPSFLASWFNLSARQSEIDSAYSRYHPKVDIIASYGTQGRDEAGLNNTITESRIGIRVSYNIYNGGADRAAVRSAVHFTEQARDLRDSACRDVRQRVQMAFTDWQNLERQIPSLNEHRLSSSLVKTAYLDQFKIGDRTLLDLLDSENEAYQAGRAYLEAIFTQYQAKLRLLAGQGQIAEALDVSRSGAEIKTAMVAESGRFDARYVCPAESIDVFGTEVNILVRDTDGDGITDLWDECENTESGAEVDSHGCSAQQREKENGVDRATLLKTPVTSSGEDKW